MNNSPLAGIRVIEVGELLAGPFIGTLLGEFGAEVIKIERPAQGDVLRRFGPIVNGESLYWSVNSRNKKSVALNLSGESGRAVLRDLLEKADILINSLRPGTLEGWGFEEDWMRVHFPQLVIVYASAFGRNGPYASKGGYDPVAQGFSGLSFLTGDTEGPPMRAGGAIPVCDFMTGVTGALGAIISLYSRDNTRNGSERGQSVDIGLYDLAFRMVGPLLSYYDLTGNDSPRSGNHSLGGAPTGHFFTRDKHWVCISVQNDDQFRRLADLMGRPDWLDDATYDQVGRTQHRNELCDAFAAYAKQYTRDELIDMMDTVGLVIGPINAMSDLADDPHLAARGSYWVEDEKLGRYRSPEVVPRLSDTPGKIRNKAPCLGENTEMVLKEILHYTAEHCATLAEKGVIGVGDNESNSQSRADRQQA